MSQIFITWIKLFHQVLSAIDIWQSKAQVRKYMPECFKALYKDIRVVIDCVEFRSERGSDLEVQAVTYSTYKQHNTHKGMVGITPSGIPSIASDLFEGSISDNAITAQSKLRDLCEKGDGVMADRGWTCKEWFAQKGIRLVTPHFLMDKDQMSIPDLVECVAIARVRIHVERCMGNIKQWRFLKQDIPLTYWNSISEIFQVCTRFCIFWPPLLKDDY